MLKPLNQLLEGLPEKQAFANRVRMPKAARSPLFADELRAAVDALRPPSTPALATGHAAVASAKSARRPTLPESPDRTRRSGGRAADSRRPLQAQAPPHRQPRRAPRRRGLQLLADGRDHHDNIMNSSGEREAGGVAQS